MPFVKAARTQKYLRMAISGVAGSGKTLGSLLVAYGITGDWNQIAVIDTENNSACLYANRQDLGIGEFLHMDFQAPYTPDRYIAAIREGAQVVGPSGVVIVDSFSHAWKGAGGVLEQKDNIAKRAGRNDFTAWGEAGKMQNSIMTELLGVPCHLIATMRDKYEYVSERDEKGKTTVRKLGLAPEQRDGVEYEFDIMLDVGTDNRVLITKDRTGIAMDGEKLSPDFGRRVIDWQSNAAPPLPPIIPAQQQPVKAPPAADHAMPPAEMVRAALQVTVPGGPFAGWTLRQLYGDTDDDARRSRLETVCTDPQMPENIKDGIGVIWAYLAARNAQGSPAAE